MFKQRKYLYDAYKLMPVPEYIAVSPEYTFIKCHLEYIVDTLGVSLQGFDIIRCIHGYTDQKTINSASLTSLKITPIDASRLLHTLTYLYQLFSSIQVEKESLTSQLIIKLFCSVYVSSVLKKFLIPTLSYGKIAVLIPMLDSLNISKCNISIRTITIPVDVTLDIIRLILRIVNLIPNYKVSLLSKLCDIETIVHSLFADTLIDSLDTLTNSSTSTLLQSVKAGIQHSFSYCIYMHTIPYILEYPDMLKASSVLHLNFFYNLLNFNTTTLLFTQLQESYHGLEYTGITPSNEQFQLLIVLDALSAFPLMHFTKEVDSVDTNSLSYKSLFSIHETDQQMTDPSQQDNYVIMNKSYASILFQISNVLKSIQKAEASTVDATFIEFLTLFLENFNMTVYCIPPSLSVTIPSLEIDDSIINECIYTDDRSLNTILHTASKAIGLSLLYYHYTTMPSSDIYTHIQMLFKVLFTLNSNNLSTSKSKVTMKVSSYNTLCFFHHLYQCIRVVCASCLFSNKVKDVYIEYLTSIYTRLLELLVTTSILTQLDGLLYDDTTDLVNATNDYSPFTSFSMSKYETLIRPPIDFTHYIIKHYHCIYSMLYYIHLVANKSSTLQEATMAIAISYLNGFIDKVHAIISGSIRLGKDESGKKPVQASLLRYYMDYIVFIIYLILKPKLLASTYDRIVQWYQCIITFIYSTDIKLIDPHIAMELIRFQFSFAVLYTYMFSLQSDHTITPASFTIDPIDSSKLEVGSSDLSTLPRSLSSPKELVHNSMFYLLICLRYYLDQSLMLYQSKGIQQFQLLHQYATSFKEIMYYLFTIKDCIASVFDATPLLHFIEVWYAESMLQFVNIWLILKGVNSTKDILLMKEYTRGFLPILLETVEDLTHQIAPGVLCKFMLLVVYYDLLPTTQLESTPTKFDQCILKYIHQIDTLVEFNKQSYSFIVNCIPKIIVPRHSMSKYMREAIISMVISNSDSHMVYSMPPKAWKFKVNRQLKRLSFKALFIYYALFQFETSRCVNDPQHCLTYVKFDLSDDVIPSKINFTLAITLIYNCLDVYYSHMNNQYSCNSTLVIELFINALSTKDKVSKLLIFMLSKILKNYTLLDRITLCLLVECIQYLKYRELERTCKKTYTTVIQYLDSINGEYLMTGNNECSLFTQVFAYLSRIIGKLTVYNNSCISTVSECLLVALSNYPIYAHTLSIYHNERTNIQLHTHTKLPTCFIDTLNVHRTCLGTHQISIDIPKETLTQHTMHIISTILTDGTHTAHTTVNYYKLPSNIAIKYPKHNMEYNSELHNFIVIHTDIHAFISELIHSKLVYTEYNAYMYHFITRNIVLYLSSRFQIPITTVNSHIITDSTDASVTIRYHLALLRQLIVMYPLMHTCSASTIDTQRVTLDQLVDVLIHILLQPACLITHYSTVPIVLAEINFSYAVARFSYRGDPDDIDLVVMMLDSVVKMWPIIVRDTLSDTNYRLYINNICLTLYNLFLSPNRSFLINLTVNVVNSFFKLIEAILQHMPTNRAEWYTIGLQCGYILLELVYTCIQYVVQPDKSSNLNFTLEMLLHLLDIVLATVSLRIDVPVALSIKPINLSDVSSLFPGDVASLLYRIFTCVGSIQACLDRFMMVLSADALCHSLSQTSSFKDQVRFTKHMIQFPFNQVSDTCEDNDADGLCTNSFMFSCFNPTPAICSLQFDINNISYTRVYTRLIFSNALLKLLTGYSLYKIMLFHYPFITERKSKLNEYMQDTHLSKLFAQVRQVVDSKYGSLYWTNILTSSLRVDYKLCHAVYTSLRYEIPCLPDAMCTVVQRNLSIVATCPLFLEFTYNKSIFKISNLSYCDITTAIHILLHIESFIGHDIKDETIDSHILTIVTYCIASLSQYTTYELVSHIAQFIYLTTTMHELYYKCGITSSSYYTTHEDRTDIVWHVLNVPFINCYIKFIMRLVLSTRDYTLLIPLLTTLISEMLTHNPDSGPIAPDQVDAYISKHQESIQTLIQPLIGVVTNTKLAENPNLISTSIGTGPIGTGPIGTGPISTGPIGTGPIGTGPIGTGPISTGPIGTGPIGTGPIGTGPIGTGPIGTGPIGTGPIGTGPIGTGPIGTGPIGTGPIGTGPIGTGPIGTGPIGTGPISTGPIGTGPISTGPIGTGPIGTGPIGTGPIGTGPIGTGPIGTGPIGTGPIGTGPINGACDIDGLIQGLFPSFCAEAAPVAALYCHLVLRHCLAHLPAGTRRGVVHSLRLHLALAGASALLRAVAKAARPAALRRLVAGLGTGGRPVSLLDPAASIAAIRTDQCTALQSATRCPILVAFTTTDTMATHTDTMATHTDTMATHTDTMATHTDTMATHTDTMATHTDTIATHTDTMATHTDTIATHTDTIATHTDTMATHTDTMATHTDTMATHTDTMATHTDTMATHTDTMATHTDTMATHTDTMATHTDTIATHTDTIATHTDTIATHTDTIATHTDTMATHTDTIATHTDTIATHTDTIATHTDTMATHTDTMATHTDTMATHTDTRDIATLAGIFKSGDDCRQDQFVVQLLCRFSVLFMQCRIDCYVRPYKVLALSHSTGIIECIPNTTSRSDIGKLTEGGLMSYFIKKFSGDGPLYQARLCFAKSMAAYSAISYILSIKDRHNGNLLLDDQGHIIHIDFGYIFEISPGGSINFETSPFKLTVDMLQVLGDPAYAKSYTNSDIYQTYLKTTIQCFMAISDNASELIRHVESLMHHDFTCFNKEKSIQNLKERLGLHLPSIDRISYFHKLINRSKDHYKTNLYDTFQYYAEGVYK